MILYNYIKMGHDLFVTIVRFSGPSRLRIRDREEMSITDLGSGVALWRQVADGIERDIADGRFVEGEKLPGETQIAELFRVNRHTVRRALAALAARGYVRAERGSGTFVERARLAYPLRSRTRFSEIVGAGGREPRGRLIAASEEVASAQLAKLLNLKVGAPLTRIEALRLADSVPICVATTWLSAERFAGAGRIYKRAHSMTKVLAHFGVRNYRRAESHVSAAIVNAADAGHLKLPLGRAVLIVDSTDVEDSGKPLLTTHARFAAERVEFIVENG